MEFDIATDLRVLEELDFPVPCGHSQHGLGDFSHDDGPAKFIAVTYHDCPSQPDKDAPYYYPCCATWATYVTLNGTMGRSIVCTRCGQQGEWSEVVHIVGSLT